MLTIADIVADCVYIPDDFVIRALKKDVVFQKENFDGANEKLMDSLCEVLQYYMPESHYEDWYNTTFEVK